MLVSCGETVQMRSCACALLDYNNTHKYFYTTLTSFSTKYHVMCKVYTDVGGIKELYHVCPLVHKIIHSLKLVDYLHVQVDKPWYNYYKSNVRETDILILI